METFCTTSRHSKFRPTLNSNSFYQASTYSRNYRQNEYGFANSTRNSALLWHERPHPPPKKSKGKLCSIALAAAAFIVLVAVLSIAGLALYMGALRTEPSNPLATFTCSAKVLRGDRFISGLSEKGRRYRLLLESLYQRSILGPSIVSCTVERFGNDTLTVYFRVTLNRRKIPRHIYNIEKSLKDILLGDALSRKPVFRNVRFDPRSVTIKQTADSESYQRVITKPKELPKAKPAITAKPPIKTNLTVTADLPVKRKPVVEEVDIKDEDLPVIQGSFKISKTEADITEKKGNVGTVEVSTQKPKTTTTKIPRRPTLKETSITSALFKLASADKIPKETTIPTTTTAKITTTPPAITVVELKEISSSFPTTPKAENVNPVLFSVSPSVFNQEPWVPIYSIPETHVEQPKIAPFNYEHKVDLPKITPFNYESIVDEAKLTPFNYEPKMDQPTITQFNYDPKVDQPKIPQFNYEAKVDQPKISQFNFEPKVDQPKIPQFNYDPKVDLPKVTQYNYEQKVDQPTITQFKYDPNADQPTITQFSYEPKVEIPQYNYNQQQQPVYTSFTNPGLSFHSFDSEKLGSTNLRGHPIPVNKIAELTEPSVWETTANYYNSGELDSGTQFTTLPPVIEEHDDDLYDLHTSDGNYEDSPGFVEVETLKYVPGSALNETTKAESERSKVNLSGFDKTYNDTLQAVMVTDRTNFQLKQSAVLKNISSIFHSLASSLGIAPIHFNNIKRNQTVAPVVTTKAITEAPVTEITEAPVVEITDSPVVEITEAPFIKITSVRTTLAPVLNITEAPVIQMAQVPLPADEIVRGATNVGQGLAEVVDADEISLMMQTTKLPLVTLLPVKSNSGVGRPIRPRPKPQNVSISENRSFPSDSSKLNLNDFSNPVKYIETEVVTSVSSEQHKVKVNRSKLDDYKIVSVLNFQTEIPNVNTAAAAPLVAEKVITSATDENMFRDEVAVISMNSSSSSYTDEGFQYLTPEKLKHLSEISKLSDNNTKSDDGVISTKAVSSSYTINHSGFKILTKTFNKIPTSFKDEEKKSAGTYNSFYLDITNKSDCSNFTVKCGDGQCLPDTTRCNQLVDCNDGSDEKNCNCADYLRSQFLLRKICDGIVDCWDFSDENHCEWCTPGQYVCGNSKVCINRTSICDGLRDCPHGDDERQCVTVAPTLIAADEFPYHSEGYLMVRKHGKWGKLCVDNFINVVAKSQTSWEISDLGQAVCKAMTYQSLDNVKILTENKFKSIHRNSKYFELTYSFQNETKSSLTFENTTCDNGEVVRVKCQSLECGARPQATKQIARIVGGGNAGLGAWPWQAALYKEGEFQCGATLISEKWLLSAGHCFYHSLEEHWVARLGALRRGTALPSPYEQLRPIIQIILHPGYVDAGFINDISLLKMEVPVIFSDYVRPICLPPAGMAPRDGRICTVVGWGQLFEIGRIFPDTLQEVQIPVISTAECRKRTLFLPLYRVTDDMFCAGYDRGGRDACLGDSGGPLMCPESDGRWVLHGITSNGYGCARAYRPGVYTKVANYINWINPYIYNDNNTSNPIRNMCTGHRCPLGECLPKSRLCNGFIECSDGSDEHGCLSN